MVLSSTLLFFFSLFYCSFAHISWSFETHRYYVLEHDPTGPASLHQCAKHLGVEVIRQVGELENHWVVSALRNDLDKREGGDPVLERYEVLKKRAHSGLEKRSADTISARDVISSVGMPIPQELNQRVKRDLSSVPEYARGSAKSPKPSERPSQALATRLGILDPIFPEQWHIVNDRHPENTMNVTGLWEMGITGKGVIAAMIDDGVDYESDDLKDNYDPTGSYDFNDRDPYPKPVLDDDHHGTRCAGEIAAAKNNVCGVGLAYDAKIAGLRILSAKITDVDEAVALNYGYQSTSIYSCSWGPPDNGKAMAGPDLLLQRAVLKGINKGRGGKGSIFVFASGNGAFNGDQCNFDGYTNSIYSVTVGAVDGQREVPMYSEACTAVMIVTYSSGSGEHIHTTDVGKNQCTSSHGGTSAAAPLAVGVFALALSVRPDLTWRDVQHLCFETAIQINEDDESWEMTASKKYYSNQFGWGLLDAYRYVTAAKQWTLVKPQAWLESKIVELKGADMDPETKNMTGGEPLTEEGVTSSIEITEKARKDNNFERLEHITVRVWISHERRGEVEVELTSPNGISSSLASTRRRDDSKKGFVGWTFMTVKHWNENPVGNWTLKVSDQDDSDYTGNFLGWSMTLWGESIDPAKAKPYALPTSVTPLPPQTGALDLVFHQSMRDHPWRTVGIGLGVVLSVICTIVLLHRCRSHRYVALPQAPTSDEDFPVSAMEQGTMANIRKASYLRRPVIEDDEDPQEHTFLMGRSQQRPPAIVVDGHSRNSYDGDREDTAIMKSAKMEDGRSRR